jgi:hypothetical protein
MSREWIVSIGGRTYGPYTTEEMKSFAVEDRLAPHSLIARAEDGRFRPAAQDADLAFLFRPAERSVTARKVSPPAEAARKFGHDHAEIANEASHYLIVADMKSGSITALEEEIFKIGPAYPVMPQAWILTSKMTTGALRNLLVQKLGKLDQLFVANATQDKIAWVNLGMETETRVRRIWAKHPQLSAA